MRKFFSSVISRLFNLNPSFEQVQELWRTTTSFSNTSPADAAKCCFEFFRKQLSNDEFNQHLEKVQYECELTRRSIHTATICESCASS